MSARARHVGTTGSMRRSVSSQSACCMGLLSGLQLHPSAGGLRCGHERVYAICGPAVPRDGTFSRRVRARTPIGSIPISPGQQTTDGVTASYEKHRAYDAPRTRRCALVCGCDGLSLCAARARGLRDSCWTRNTPQIGSMTDARASAQMRCHRGHESPTGLWNCPVCTDDILAAVRRGDMAEAKRLSDQLDRTPTIERVAE